MFGLFGGKKRVERLESDVKDSFLSVKKDFEGVGKWIKHLNDRHVESSDVLKAINKELSTIKTEFEELRETISLLDLAEQNKQLSKKQTAVYKQGAVQGVQEAVQTGVQTANFYDILQGLSSNERLLVLTLMNSDLKLSYEDLARLLGKERSTVRGQINTIKQKNPDLLKERVESNGKKRVFIDEDIKEKLAKYAKVRVSVTKKAKKSGKKR